MCIKQLQAYRESVIYTLLVFDCELFLSGPPQLWKWLSSTLAARWSQKEVYCVPQVFALYWCFPCTGVFPAHETQFHLFRFISLCFTLQLPYWLWKHCVDVMFGLYMGLGDIHGGFLSMPVMNEDVSSFRHAITKCIAVWLSTSERHAPYMKRMLAWLIKGWLHHLLRNCITLRCM